MVNKLYNSFRHFKHAHATLTIFLPWPLMKTVIFGCGSKFFYVYAKHNWFWHLQKCQFKFKYNFRDQWLSFNFNRRLKVCEWSSYRPSHFSNGWRWCWPFYLFIILALICWQFYQTPWLRTNSKIKVALAPSSTCFTTFNEIRFSWCLQIEGWLGTFTYCVKYLSRITLEVA